MVQRGKSYGKRPRATGDRALSMMEVTPRPPEADGGDGPRGRRRRTHFVEHMESTRALVGYGTDDRLAVARTRDLVQANVDAIVATIHSGLVSHPETAPHFLQADGAPDREQADLHEQAFRTWLLAICDAEFDVLTADHLANLGHAHVRPRTPGARPIRARFIFVTMSNVQTAVIDVLARHARTPDELAQSAVAWTKLLMIHLDLFLLVYSSTEGRARWY